MVKTIMALISIISVFFGTAYFSNSNQIQAKSYVLMERTSNKIIASSNENTKLPMASTTKIMTSIITLEQKNIYEYFEVDSVAIKVEGTSMGLREGDKVNLHVLATGMLLSSGNDAANAASVKIAGSIEKFAVLMNECAKKIGMLNTNFVTPSGLHDENHYSTAYDMALLARYAMKNEAFQAICSTKSASVEFGNPMQKRTLYNHNKLISQYDGCIGVKTGFTKKAGRCLVSAVTREDVTLICVTLGASDDWNVHKKLFDYGFSSVKSIEIPTKTESILIDVVGGQKEKLIIYPENKATGVIEEDDIINLKEIVILDKFYYAPIKQGSIVGEIKYYLNEYEVATTTLIAGEGTEIATENKKKWFK